MNILISIVAFIAAVCCLIIWHEFGHFVVMRLFGIKVLRFSVFFGKPLLRWKRNTDSTEVAFGWLPLGGYVKPLDEREGDVPASEKHLAFNRQPLYKRFFSVLAGPAFNFIFAILAYWVIFMIGVPGTRPLIGDIRPGSPAAHAGFVQQDEILSINGDSTPTWEMAMVRLFAGSMHGQSITVRVRTPDHNEKQLVLITKKGGEIPGPDKLLEELGFSQWRPRTAPEISGVQPDGTAQQAGLKKGDLIQKVNTVPIISRAQLIKILRASPNKKLKVQIQRGTETINLVLPVGVQKTPDGTIIGHIGALITYPDSILRLLQVEQRYNPAAAIGHAVMRTGSLTWLTLDAGWNMVMGRVSVRNLGGPIEIAQAGYYTAESGLVPFLAFLAFISVNLGVINLLPIPLLDGGHILYYLVEAVKGSPLSISAEMVGQRIGIALLLMLMSFVIYNDLMRLFG